MRRYRELMQLTSFEERFKYLKLSGEVGRATFGFDRYINQALYNSKRWKKTRRDVIIRDNGCDLGVDGYDIFDKIIIHHMNPLSIEDVESGCDDIFDLEFLICTSHNTHNAIHYGNERLLPRFPTERKPGDTCPWL